MVLKTHDDLE